MHLIKSNKIISQENVVLILRLLLLSGTSVYSKLKKERPYVMHLIDRNDSSCHQSTEGDVLPSAEGLNFNPRTNSIFFHETSCRGGLTSRQACAVEAAARAHPEREVYVLFNAPVREIVLTKSCMAQLRLLPNVKFARVNMTEYVKRTPMQLTFYKSKWWVAHTSDVIRVITLYKWGGLYLDLDVIVVKSLTPLGYNWVAKETQQWVNGAIVAISTDFLGRKFSLALLNEVANTYKADLFSYNGPKAFTRVLKRFCSTPNVKLWSARTCQGLEIYEPELIYPIYYDRAQVYFKKGKRIDGINKAYTHHLWNQITHYMKIQQHSLYDRLARRFCPTIRNLYGNQFGSF